MAARGLAELHSEYLRALIEGDPEAAAGTVDEALARGWSPLGLYTGLLAPAQARIGQLWLDGRLNAAQEHLATEITSRQMGRLRARLSPRASLGLRAVVASVEGDAHQLGARMVADFLHFDGWDVDFLGASVPSSDLVAYVRQRRADLVGLSVTLRAQLPEAARVIERLGRLDPAPRTLVGGGALAGDPELGAGLGADAIAADAMAALHAARGLFDLGGAAASLDEVLAELGRRVQALRKARDMSQRQLGEAAELDRTYISAVENGRQNLTVGALLKLARGLGVAPEELLRGVG